METREQEHSCLIEELNEKVSEMTATYSALESKSELDSTNATEEADRLQSTIQVMQSDLDAAKEQL